MAIVMRTCEVTVQTNHGLVFKVLVPTADSNQADKEATLTLRQQQEVDPGEVTNVHQWMSDSIPMRYLKR